MTRQADRVWDAAAVLAASNEWSWVPDGAPHVRTDEYLVVDSKLPRVASYDAAVRAFVSFLEVVAA